MSITITITGDAVSVRDEMHRLLNVNPFAAPDGEPLMRMDQVRSIAESGAPWPWELPGSPEHPVEEIVKETIRKRVETPEPEITTPPGRKSRAMKKAETVIQPDVTDIEPVPADEFAGKTTDEIAEILKPLMIDAVKAKGQDAVFAILKEFKVANRSEAAKLPNVGEFAARLRKEVE